MKYYFLFHPLRTLFCACLLLLAGCAKEDVSASGDDGVEIHFTLPGISAATRASADKLAVGTTVRVMAWSTSNNTHRAEHVYNVAANGDLVSQTGGALKLAAGTYRLYAITPASIRPDSYAVGVPVFQISHLTDYASSSTLVTITSAMGGSTRTVFLTQLERKCSKLTFEVEPAQDIPVTVTDTEITEIRITNMRNAPQPATGDGDVQLGNGGDMLILTNSSANTTFARDADNPRKAMCSTIVMPKGNGTTFNLSAKVRFNGVNSVTTQFPQVTIPSMGFAKGTHYLFSLKLTKDKIQLWLTVSQWTTSNQDYGLGGVPGGPVNTQLIGEWRNITWENNLGGVPTGPILTGISNWWNNIYYNPHLGSSDPGSND